MDAQGNCTNSWEFERLSPEDKAKIIARSHQEWQEKVTPAISPNIDRSKLPPEARQALDDDVAPMTEAQRAALLTPTDPRATRQVAEEARWKGQDPLDAATIALINNGGWK